MSSTPQVLIIGAGPTGLAAACTLRLNGVDCRIIDRRAEISEGTKALVMWSGALEVTRRLGVSDGIVAAALPLSSASYWSAGRQVGRVVFGGLRGTAFPGPLCLPQPVVERLLEERLAELGVTVERGSEAVSCRTVADRVEVEVKTAQGDTHTLAVPWLIAADGGRSMVRQTLGIAFQGSTYERDFLLGDGTFTGATHPTEAQYHMTPEGVLVIVPLPGGGHRVFFDTEPAPAAGPPDDALLQRLLDERVDGRIRLERVWWRSRFRVHAQIAERFRHGRVFLAGDAAHVHSPAGGQGLNTGIQDGYDIAWKLAAVLRGAPDRLLESYPAERRTTSATAVRNADRQTRLWLLRSPVARKVRDTAMRLLSRTGVLERQFVPQLAQIDHDYRTSPGVVPAGTEALGSFRLGRRAPDSPLEAVGGDARRTLHEYLAHGRHTVLIAGAAARSAAEARQARAELPDDVAVLRLLPPGTAPGRLGEAAGVDTAVDTDSVAGTGDALRYVYIRPDAVVGSLAQGGSVTVFLKALALPVSGPQPAENDKGVLTAERDDRP